MIPKIIHYCWYGKGEKGSVIEMCIASWRKYCPDFQIKEWNEGNSPMDNPWVKSAYKHQKYAFVADYVRFYALSTEGGVYLDTDMLLIKPIDCFLAEDAFLGREDGRTASMGIIGSVKNHQFCSACLRIYDNLKFCLSSPPIITRLISPELESFGFVEKNISQRLSNGLEVLASDYFYPIHYTTSFDINDLTPPDYGGYITQNTYGIHLWNKSWSDEFQQLMAGDYKAGFKAAFARIKRNPFLPYRYYKRLLKYIFIFIFRH